MVESGVFVGSEVVGDGFEGPSSLDVGVHGCGVGGKELCMRGECKPVDELLKGEGVFEVK